MTRVVGIILAAVVAAGCVPASLVPYTLDLPPVTLTPVAQTRVEDGRGRFREIYCAVRRRGGAGQEGEGSCEAELLRLADEPEATGRPVELSRARLPMRVLVVPGIYGDCLPVLPFADALPRLESLGHRTGRIEVGGFSSVAENAARIRDAIAALDLDPREPLVLVGYSKGVADLLAALVAYPEVRERVTALVAVAGVVAGSPLADRVDSDPLLSPVAEMAALACPRRDRAALDDLRRSTRLLWLSRNRLPETVRYYTLAGFGERDRISWILRTGYDMLATIDPRNDGAVIFSDAIVPGSKLLGFARADHWAIALPVGSEMPKAAVLGFNRNDFPREALLEAVVRTVEEDLLSRR